MSSDPVVTRLTAILDLAYDRSSWHGTNLRGSLRGLTADAAAWRPAPERHNIWEIAVHAAYWKYTAWRRLTGAARGSFPVKGSDWFPRPAAGLGDAKAWRADLALLQDMHRQLREAIERLAPRQLDKRVRGTSRSAFELAAGVAAHDLYHAGQIQLIKRLRGPRIP